MSGRVLLGASVAAFVALATVAIGSILADEPESAFVAGGRGASPLVQDAGLQGLETLRLLSGPLALATDPDHDPAKTLLVIVSPSRPFDDEEVRSIHRFLEDGGRLLVADDFGHANSVTSGLGITFERVRIVDADGAVQATASLGGRSFDLWVDTPTALRTDPALTPTVLAVTREGSFLDRDGTGAIDAGDPLGPFPLAVAVDVGLRGGGVTAVSDTAPFLEAGSDQADNREFRQSLLAVLLPDGGRVVLDESRDPSTDPWLRGMASFVAAATRTPGRYVVGALAVALPALGAILAMQDRWGPHVFQKDRFVRRADLAGPGARRPPAAGRPRQGSVHWTSRGRAAVLGGLALLVLGIMAGSRQATYAAALLLLAGALAMWARPVHAQGIRQVSPAVVQEDAAVQVDLAIATDGGRGGRVEVLDGLPSEIDLTKGSNWFQATLGPNPCRVRYEVQPSLRGPYEIGPLLIRSTDPFRLRCAETQALDAPEILVQPRHAPLSRIPFPSKFSALTLGPHLVNRAGDGSEFHALRDYQSGDSIRSINWKASARSGEFVVNQRVHESMSTITVFVDARAISGAGPLRNNPLNEACRAALSIATGAVQARDRVRVFAYGDGVQELAPGTGPQKMHDLGTGLARLEPRGAMPLRAALAEVLPSLKARTPFILVSGLEGDPSLADAMRDLRQRNILPTVLVAPIGTRPGPASGPEEPDSRRLEAEHEKAMADIQGLGAPVVRLVADRPLSMALRLGLA